jgi:hypothetical protein
LLLVVFMEKRIGFDLRPIAWHAIAFAGGASVASAATMLAARYVENSMGGTSSLFVQVAEIAAGGLVGLVTYLAWSRLFRLPELDAAVELVRTLLGRRRETAAELPED